MLANRFIRHDCRHLTHCFRQQAGSYKVNYAPIFARDVRCKPVLQNEMPIQ